MRAVGSKQRSVALLLALVAVSFAVRPSGARAEPPEPEPRSFTAALTGDLIAHVSINRNAKRFGGGTDYDYRPMFDDVRPIIEGADLAICSLEGPIAPRGRRYAGSPRFASPAAITRSIRDVGYDRCSVATNHTNDQGPSGIVATLDAFDAVGLGHSGAGRDAAGAVAEIFEVRGVRVAHLAYTFGISGLPRLLRTSTARVNILGARRVIADAIDARARGAEVVIASLHWGQEYQQAVTPAQARIARQITASGQVDLIAGSHAHVLQRIAQVNGTWVLFGLGNHLSTQNSLTIRRSSTADGVIARVRFTERQDGRFEVSRPTVIPTWVHHRKYVVMDVFKHLDDTSLPPDILRNLRSSWRRTSRLLSGFVEPLPG